MKKGIGIFMVLLASLFLIACEKKSTINLTENLSSKKEEKKEALPDETELTDEEIEASGERKVEKNQDLADFSVKLFRESVADNKNTLISPFSILYALGMTMNGANEGTLTEMEEVLGLKEGEMNSYFKEISLPKKKGEARLKDANSIWVKDDGNFVPEEAFLKKNAEIYGAEVFQAAFHEGTRKDINSWVEKKTDGLIKEILDNIPEDAVMYLINALSFDGEWDRAYEDYQMGDEEFTSLDGKKSMVSMMRGEEFSYLENEKITGFYKNYKGSRYSFLGILPKEGVDIKDYLSHFTAKELRDLWKNKKSERVITGLPKFKTEYDIEMSEVLKALGMKKAFSSDEADFRRLGKSKNNIYISRVLHKTFIEVDENGTKAGASTAVEMKEEAMALPPEEPKEVILNRPFIYVIMDKKTELPIFMGTVFSLSE